MVTRWMEHREAEVKLIGVVSKLYGILRFQNNILLVIEIKKNIHRSDIKILT